WHHRLCHAARRQCHRRPYGHSRRTIRTHRAQPSGAGPHHLCQWRHQGPALGQPAAAGALFHGRRSRPQRLTVRNRNMTGTLILVRHGQSEWNLKNLFTGWRNPNLTEQGEGEARATGKALKAAGIVPDLYYTSALRRAQHTLDLMLEEMGILNVTI